MRKSIFFMITMSLCVLNFGALSATRTDSNQTTAGGTRSATTARTTTQTNTTVTPAVVSRAATKQKAVNPGTKVATATENTAVPRECQDAFYGCMDAFCMLDNASGGRCQCSDRITELDQVLEDILKLDDQTYLMATEGVERIQMGEAEEQVMARAKAAGDKVVVVDDATKRKSRTLDLSMWNSNIFTVEDSLFDEFDSDNLVSTFADKKGDSLYTASAKMCASQITEQCKSYSSMLQLVYAQKIKSDCIAYENSLRAQKIQSQQKLQTAQKALRDAALEEYQNQNKYATVGDCAIAFTQCMQTKAECGTDYTGCVILAAQENVRNNTAGSRAKQKKIKGAISGADITLAASTMNQLLEKKKICESVTKQCVNANKNDAVWDLFLRNAAPALKSAELIAEQNLRSNCIPTLAECYKTACKDNVRTDEEYDLCLSNPETYKSLCKVQLEPCLEATGGSYDNPTASSLWNGLVALLKAVQVDTCTAQVKSCIMNACGEDYSECIGLSVDVIDDLCPVDTLTACVQDGKYADGRGGVNTGAIRDYVAEIAQGLALQIDNALANACQNAANDAMIRVCGDTETCESVIQEDSSGSRALKYEICEYRTGRDGSITWTNNCRDSFEGISEAELNSKNWAGRLSGVIYWDNITNDDGEFVTADQYISRLEQEGSTLSDYDKSIIRERIFGLEINQIKNAINITMSTVESDPKVDYCMNGRSVPGFRGFAGITAENNNGFANLTQQIRQIVTAQAINQARENYLKKYDEAIEQMMQDQVKAADFVDHEAAIESARQTCANWAKNSALPVAQKPINSGRWVAAALTALVPTGTIVALVLSGRAIIETVNDSIANKDHGNENEWHSTIDQWNYIATINTMFDEKTGVCTKETISRTCIKEKKNRNICKEWGEQKVNTQEMQLL